MKEFLGYSIVLAAAALHMSPKTIQHCVLKCLSAEEVKAYDDIHCVQTFFLLFKCANHENKRTLCLISQ